MDTKTNGGKMVNGKVVIALMAGTLLSALLALPRMAFAYGVGDAGTTGVQSLKLPVGARAVGMGGAYTAIADDVDSIHYNVAGLAMLDKKNAEYMFGAYNDTNKVTGESNPSQHWIAFGMPISEQIGAAGIGFQYFSYGDINQTDVRAANLGTFTPNDLAVNFSWAHKFMGTCAAGATVKVINSKIQNTATTAGFDFGVRSSMMDGKAMLGATVKNLGGTLQYETANTRLPLTLNFGAGYKLMEGWLWDLDAKIPTDDQLTFAIGTDYKYKINDDSNISGRVGYNSVTRNVDSFSSVSFGVGFGFKMGTLDYAFSPMGDLMSVHRISLGVKF